jgi:hypothetical protein
MCRLANVVRTLVLAGVAGPLAAGSVLADPVTEQINQGLELYQSNDYGAAITELEFAINDIRKLMSERIADTFPEPPAGWSAQAAESSSESAGAAALFGGSAGTMLERTYTQDSGEGTMTATLTIDNPMVQGMAALLNNPMLMAAQPNTERLRIGRETGMLKWEPDAKRAEATLMLDGRIMMQVRGDNLQSGDVAAELLKAWDIDAVRAQSAR